MISTPPSVQSLSWMTSLTLCMPAKVQWPTETTYRRTASVSSKAWSMWIPGEASTSVSRNILNPFHPGFKLFDGFSLLLGWLAVMAACFLYNAWVIPLRWVFFSEQSFYLWFIADYCVMDLLYIIDIMVFKHRLLYMENGFWVKVFN